LKVIKNCDYYKNKIVLNILYFKHTLKIWIAKNAQKHYGFQQWNSNFCKFINIYIFKNVPTLRWKHYEMQFKKKLIICLKINILKKMINFFTHWIFLIDFKISLVYINFQISHFPKIIYFKGIRMSFQWGDFANGLSLGIMV
jgi:hypothetical protein